MPFRANYPIHVPRSRKNPLFMITLLLVLLASSTGLAACGLLRQQVPTSQPKVMHVTADVIARAMQEDHFYSDYNPYALIVQGVVTGVKLENKDYILEMATQIDTKVWCDFGSQEPNAKAGDSIEVLSPHANQAQRQPNVVLLVDCSIP